MRILAVLFLVLVAGCGLSFGQKTGDGIHALCVVKVEGLKKEVPLVLPTDDGEDPLGESHEDVLSIQVIKDEAGLKPFIEKYGEQAKPGVVVITLKSLDNVSESVKQKFGEG